MVPLQVVTMGRSVCGVEQMQKAGDYSRVLPVRPERVLGEGLAEWTHELVLK